MLENSHQIKERFSLQTEDNFSELAAARSLWGGKGLICETALIVNGIE